MIKNYLLLILALLFVLALPQTLKPMIGRYRSIRASPHKKRLIILPFWDMIDKFSKMYITKGWYFKEHTPLYKFIDKFIAKNKYPLITNKRLQTMSILSVAIMAIFLVLQWTMEFVNVLIHHQALQKLAEEVGNPTLATITPPGLTMFIPLLLAYCAPYLIIKFIMIMRHSRMANEAMMLQSYAVMLLETSTSIFYVIETLMNQSNYYKEVFRTCLHLYSTSPERAITMLKEQSNDERFHSIALAIEKGLNIDRIMAASYLRSKRDTQTKMAQIKRQKKDSSKDIIGTLLLLLPLLSLAFTVGYPWLLLVQKLLTDVNIM